ncbi:MAG: response regulator [Marinilabiliaceae bacterium]|nr:response regulator [Marinilabiliaceae bacterium]
MILVKTSVKKVVLTKCSLLLLGWLLLIGNVLAQRTPDQDQFIDALNLSPTEKEWLDLNYVVRVHPDTWPPFNYWDIKTGTNQGICVEYLRWIAQKTGIIFEYPSMWMPLKHILPALEHKQLDLSPSLQKTPDRQSYLLFSEVIHKESFSLFGKQTLPKGEKVFEKPGLRISSEEGSKTYQYLKLHYPNAIIVPTITEEDGLRKVMSKEVDYHAGAASVCNYLIRTYYGLQDLKLARKLDYEKQGVYMAARNDWPELITILNKSMHQMPPSHKQEIIDSYLHKTDWNKYKNYLFWAMAILILVLSVIALLLKHSMQKQKEQKKKLQQDDLKLQQASEMAGLHFMEYHPKKQVLHLGPKSALFLTGNALTATMTLRQCLKLIYFEDLSIIKRTIRSFNYDQGEAMKFRVIHPSGQLIHLNCFINRQLHLEKKSAPLLLSCLDISREVVYNYQLLSTQRLAHIGYFRFHAKTRQYHLSDEARNILHIDDNDAWIPAMKLIRLVPHKNMHETIQQIRQSVKERKQEFKTTLEVNKRGQVQYLHFINRFFFDAKGRVVMNDGYIQDITELKKTETLLEEAKNQAEKANKAKSIFLARMSHEIRTPLSAIIGMLNLTFKTKLTPKQNNYLKKTKTASNILLNLINDILDFSKIEANKTSLNHTHFNLPHSLRDIEEMLSPKAVEKGLTLSINLPDTIPQWVYADELRLKQVLINLVNNAIKFTHEGSIQVSIESIPATTDEVALHFSIADTGIGIMDEKLKLLFQSFMQVDESFVRQYEGSGLGLAICKRIVELWGGSIDVESNYGKGSVFHFTFKAKAGVQPAIIPSPAATLETSLKLIKQPKVLLAEDNQLNQEIACEILKETGAKIDVVENGIKAFKAIAANHYDMVFMDVHMPVANGITTTRLIRQKLNNQLPIIAVTAYALSENKQSCLEAGMTDFISKPFVGEDITKMMIRWLPDFFEQENNRKTTSIPTCTDTTMDQVHLNWLNTSCIEKYYSGNTIKYHQYLDFFQKSYPDRKQTLLLAKQEGNIDSIKGLAHTIKGEAGYLGLEKLHHVCEQVNKQTNASNYLKMADELGEFMHQTNLVIEKTI